MDKTTPYKHIVLDDKVGPIIENTNKGVVHIVLYMKAFGWSPEKIHLEYPNLSLGQIHSALA